MPSTMSCQGGHCQGKLPGGLIRCAAHAAEYAKAQMESQGWVCITEYGSNVKPATPEFFKMLEAVHCAGMEMQHTLAGWDSDRGTPKFGVWAPRIAAVILGTVADRLTAAELTGALIASKVDLEFIMAVDAAFKMGGMDAAHEMLNERLPMLRTLNQKYRTQQGAVGRR